MSRGSLKSARVRGKIALRVTKPSDAPSAIVTLRQVFQMDANLPEHQLDPDRHSGRTKLKTVVRRVIVSIILAPFLILFALCAGLRLGLFDTPI